MLFRSVDGRTFVTSPYHVSFPPPRTSTSIPTAKSDVFNGSFSLRFGFAAFFALTGFSAFAFFALFAFAFVVVVFFAFVVFVVFVVAVAVAFAFFTGVPGALPAPVIAVNCAAMFAISALLAAVSASRRRSASSSRRVALASIARNVSSVASFAIFVARGASRGRPRASAVDARVGALCARAPRSSRARVKRRRANRRVES